MLRQAGFTYATVPTNSDACYYYDPVSGGREWNTGEVVGQNPSPGTEEPLGSTVDLQVCAGQLAIP